MNEYYKPSLVGTAKSLRKGMTKEEKKLWYRFLKRLPVTVNRQKVLTHYIADFYCASAKLVIEVDGAQHYTEANAEKDRIRDAFFLSCGLEVVRYTNYDVNRNFEGVCL
ncbi:MAG: endonuclease domain-containing protein, partial [Clostridia bacterium]|nr:endonuclease domain-containing protein [Clostridia bacterium]